MLSQVELSHKTERVGGRRILRRRIVHEIAVINGWFKASLADGLFV